MKKILVFTPYFYPNTGGVAMHTFNLYSRIARKKAYSIKVVTSGSSNTLEKLNDIVVQRLSYKYRLSNTPINLSWYFEIKRIIKDFNPHLIAVHTPVPFMSDLAVFGAGNIPLVVKYHHAGSMLKGKFFPDIIIRIYENTIYKYVMRKAKFILTSSEFTARTFFQKYKHKTVAISPGVDTNRFTPNNKNAGDKNKIFFLGSLNKAERYKGLEYLILAMPIVKARIPNAKLIVVSPGDFQSFYENLAVKTGVGKDVVFKGKLLDDKLVAELQDSSVVVLPSVFDSSPNILLEAMACAKPIVGSNMSGIPDMVTDGENGLLVKPTDPKDIAEKIIKVLSDKNLAKRLGENGLRRVKEEYTWERKAKQTEEVFKKVWMS